ncbi:JAB domain-containing protein [Novosphingobium terrae]|uniref:JAB domain-containing protein n=1 Tax=Novosphingobium terrae TaxID=2726189 RepID=UPI00197DBC34|nr:JAB domain-containing protein [Novosphingobium terrae]
MAGNHESIAKISNHDIADLITSAWKTCRLALREILEARPVISSSQALIDYLRSEMAFLPNERVYVLFLTSRLRLITEKVISQGDGREAAIRPHDITDLAKSLGATGIIIAHNHPSGNPEPSAADKQATLELDRICQRNGIRLLDHLIISRSGWNSLKALGHLTRTEP